MPGHRFTDPRISRRDFARFLALTGSAFLPQQLSAWPAPLRQTSAHVDERFWTAVREQFLMPADLAVMNAANLCPSPAPVLEAMYRSTKDVDADPSFDNRRKMTTGKEEARRLVARALRVTAGEIVLTRNTSEVNNIVSSGLDLGAEDEVIVFSDNHPSNHSGRAASTSPGCRLRSTRTTGLAAPRGRGTIGPASACRRTSTNTIAEVDRTIGAISKYMKQGV
jgi:hypothetical protein